jgi:hypothetical protein
MVEKTWSVEMNEISLRLTKRFAAIALCALAGCATQVVDQSTYKGYTVGQTLKAPVGGAFLVSQLGTTSKVRRWVGILNSSDGWQEQTQYSQGYLRKELIYGGVNGSVIEIAYREFRGNLAAPAFFQNVKYDLAASRTITFQNFTIAVRAATNSGFEGTLLQDQPLF